MYKCGKQLGSGMGYTRRCGGLWMCEVSQCERCNLKEKRAETVRLENELARRKLEQFNKDFAVHDATSKLQ